MTTAYTSLLGLALPVTGELSGTWGDTVNNSITSLLDSAISGTTTISTDADITLTTTTGAANEAREAILLWTAGGTVTRNITAPAQSKTYIVINKSSSTQSIVLRGVGPTTGVTIIKGEAAVCAWNGTDFIKVSNTSGSGTFSDLTVTGVASFADGTVALPSITNTGDTNTGIYFPAADTIAFTEGGAEAMRIDSSGNVGIGTSSPAYRLDVAGTTRINNGALSVQSTSSVALPSSGYGWEIYNVDSSNNYLQSYNRTGSAYMNSVYNALSHQFYISGTEQMRINSSGNVGIGTSSPSQKLEIYAAADSLQIESVVRNDQAGTGVAAIGFNTSSSSGGEATSTKAGIGLIRTNAYGVGALCFYNNGTGSAGNFTTADERMRIDSSGNVGIGVTPTSKLHVSGGRTDLVANSETYALGVRYAVGTGIYYIGATNSASPDLVFSQTGGSERMRLTDAGNLGIGTSSPTHRLDVNGVVACGTNSNGSLPTATSGLAIAQNYGGGTAGFAEVDFIYNSATYVGDNGGFRFYQRTGASTSNEMLRLTQNSVITYTGGTERMRVDSSGNVGIGITSPAYRLDVGSPSVTGNIHTFGSNANGTLAGYSIRGIPRLTNDTQTFENTYIGCGASVGTIIFQQGNSFTAASNTERMRIDSSGNVGIGTTSISALLHVAKGSAGTLNYPSGTWASKIFMQDDTPAGALVVGNRYASESSTVFEVGSLFGSGTAWGSFYRVTGSGTSIWGSSNSGIESMRLTASGILLVNSTSDVGGNNPAFSASASGNTSFSNIMEARWTGTGSIYHLLVRNGNGLIGGVQSSGSTTSFLTSSDYRLKNNIAPMTGALAKVALLKPVTYKWKADDTDGEGFIAHELAAVCPIAVHGEKDEVDADGNIKSQSIDTSFLVATLTAAIQEQQALITQQAAAITSLTARIVALEST